MAEDKLAKYIIDDVFKWLKDERSLQLENQMRRNYDAFRGRYNSDVLKRWKSTEGNDWRSKVFVRFTKAKVIAGYSAKTALMLQGGTIPWDLKPTQIPENFQGMALPMEEAKRRCSLMKGKIKDNLDEANADRPFLTSCLEDTLYGWSWLHVPILRPKISVAPRFTVPGLSGLYVPPDVAMQYGRFSLEPTRIMVPQIENPSVWNVFWDLEHPDANKGQAIILREKMSPGRFEDLKSELMGADKEAIDKILEGYNSTSDDAGDSGTVDDSEGPIAEKFGKSRRSIPTYLYYGRVPVKYLKEYAKKGGKKSEINGLDQAKDHREAEIVCLVAEGRGSSDPVIISKPVLNPFPYRPMKLAQNHELPGEASGVGVPEDCEDSQMIINGLTRAMLDNKALASNLMMVTNASKLAPGQDFSLYPGKQFKTFEGVQDVRTAVDFFSPQDITGNTPALIEMFRSFMDEEGGVSRNQSAQVIGQKKTATEIANVAEAANMMQGMIIRNKDEGQIEPMITGLYHYHMLADPDESIKGDFMPSATGFQSYKDRAVRGKVLMQMLQFSISNSFTAQFTKVLPFLREICKTADIDPDNFYPSDEELGQASDMLAKMLPQGAQGQTQGQPGQVSPQPGAPPIG